MSDYRLQKTFCPECRKDVEYQIKELVEKKEVRGLEFEYTAERAYCNECESEIFIPELHDQNLKIIDAAYRKKLEVESNLKNNLVAMTFVLSDKFLSDKDMSEIWRDYKMVKFFKYVEEQGKKEGEKQGEKKLFKKLIKGNFEGCDDKIMELIDQAEISKIEELSERISKIKDLKELEEALKQ